MNRKMLIASAAAALLAATAGGLAFAQQANRTENDAVAALTQARVTLSQAIGAAEAKAGGKATKAELEADKGGAAFTVEVVSADSKVYDVKVDADGNVLSSQQDKLDRADEEDDD